MERITQKDLEYLVKRINKITSSPMAPYTRNGEKGNRKAGFTANINNYHLDYGYGGVQLVRMVNDAGGIETISRGCHVPKRELYYWMQAYIAGITHIEINIPS